MTTTKRRERTATNKKDLRVPWKKKKEHAAKHPKRMLSNPEIEMDMEEETGQHITMSFEDNYIFVDNYSLARRDRNVGSLKI